MSVVFFGSSPFAVPALQRIAEHVELVVTQPDRPSGRGHQMQPTPVKSAALELGIPVETPLKARSKEFIESIEARKPKLLVVAAYGQILPQRLLDIGEHGAINLHGSILPKHRGAAPIQAAILDGDSETGITLMQMDAGLDTGDIIQIARTNIGSDETAGELHDRLAIIAGDLLCENLPDLLAGTYSRDPQDDSLSTYAPKIEKSDAKLELSSPAEAEYRKFRAFTPFPGAYFELKSGTLKVNRARLIEQSGKPGEVLQTSPTLVIALTNSALELLTVTPAGRKPQSGSDYARAAQITKGDCLA